MCRAVSCCVMLVHVHVLYTLNVQLEVHVHVHDCIHVFEMHQTRQGNTTPPTETAHLHFFTKKR